MGNKNSKSVFKHSEINNNIVDSINKMQSINLFTKEVLSEDQEYNLLKETKSDNFKISQKATDKISKPSYENTDRKTTYAFDYNSITINKEKLTGCSVHFVSEKLDSGKIILQKKIYVEDNDDINSLKTKVQSKEYTAYSEAIVKLYSNISS